MQDIKTSYNGFAFTGEVRVACFYYTIMNGDSGSLVVHRNTAIGNFMGGNSFPSQILPAWVPLIVAEIAGSKRTEPGG